MQYPALGDTVKYSSSKSIPYFLALVERNGPLLLALLNDQNDGDVYAQNTSCGTFQPL